LASLALFGALRLPREASPAVAGVRLRIMQPNLPQDAKFNPDNRDAIMQRYLSLSDRATSPQSTGLTDVTHLIWPESAFPFLLQSDPRALAEIGALLPAGKFLITGAARASEPLPGERPQFFNSILVIGEGGRIVASYDKVHLVPFGEYLPGPLDALLRAVGLREFVHVPGGFTPGQGRRRHLIAVPGLPPLAPTVCYEAIFPGEVLGVSEIREGTAVAAPQAPRAGLILNVTNDAWFGDTPGPRQHFAQARLRAVEEGLPLVRAANTGISAVVDPFGRVERSLSVGVEGVLDATLPARLPGRTLFDRFGHVLFAGMLLLSLAISLVAKWRGRPSP
jgi:apolipoprotein N-acyltransferase